MHSKLRFALATLALPFLLLAGCSGKSGDKAGPDNGFSVSNPSTSSATTTGASGQTGPTFVFPGGSDTSQPPPPPPPPGADRDPILFLKARAAGKNVPLAGSVYLVPADADVELDAGDSIDPDGQRLSFTWRIDNQRVPSEDPSIMANFAAGDHPVFVAVDDGRRSAGLDIIVRASGASPPPGPGDPLVTSFLFEGHLERGANLTSTAIKPLPVPAGARSITAWLEWQDATKLPSPGAVDLDLRLVDPSSFSRALSNSSDYELLRLEAAALAAGDWLIVVEPHDVPVNVNWTVKALVMTAPPFRVRQTGEVQAVGPVQLDPDLSNPVSHKLVLPAGTQYVAARLSWTGPASSLPCSAENRRSIDLDLAVLVGAVEKFESANRGACEFGFFAPPQTLGPASEWTFQVVPVAAAGAAYTLDVDYL